MQLLYLSYASEPGAGSEYGVGWMVPLTMALQHPEYDICVLTRSRCREKIEAAEKPQNLHFLFYDIPRWLYYKREMQSRWGEQYNYLLWQWMARGKVREICRTYHIDIIHHLTFNQYRTPSPGYWMDVPFVVGPIGGAECIAPSLWQDLDRHTQRKEHLRRKGYDRRIFQWFLGRRKNTKVILCSTDENLKRLSQYGNSHTRFTKLPAIGFSLNDFPSHYVAKSNSDKPFEIIYAGKALDWKGLHIFLCALRIMLDSISSSTINAKLIGIRFEEEQQKVNTWIRELGLENHVTLISFMERSKLLEIMQQCSLSVYPAFRDSGSMSVLEASAIGCPTLCFNAGGQDAFPDDVLIKVGISDTYDKTLHNLAEKLTWAYQHQELTRAIGEKARQWVADNMTWERKVMQFTEIYNSITHG